MAKFQVVLLVLCALLALVLLADAQQRPRAVRSSRQRARQFARQEVAIAEAAVTPYPSADELKPEVPFEEAAAEPTPDEVYGPPDAPVDAVPDEVYGPPDVAGNDLPADDAAAAAPADAELAPAARLVAARRLANYRRRQAAAYRQANAARAAVRPAKLRAVTQVRRTA